MSEAPPSVEIVTPQQKGVTEETKNMSEIQPSAEGEKLQQKEVIETQPSAEGKTPQQKSYLKRYFSQAVPATEEERRKRDEKTPKDENPFTLRGFIHDNVAQSIKRETPPPRPNEEKKEELGEKKEELGEKKEEPKKERKPFGQRMKEAFGRGQRETNKPDFEEGAGKEEAKKEEEDAPVQGPGRTLFIK